MRALLGSRVQTFWLVMVSKPLLYDRNPEIGGLLTFGIPEFKLEKPSWFDGVKCLKKWVEFKLKTEIGKDISIDKLLADYDAVFMGMGTYNYMKGGSLGKTYPACTMPFHTSYPM